MSVTRKTIATVPPTTPCTLGEHSKTAPQDSVAKAAPESQNSQQYLQAQGRSNQRSLRRQASRPSVPRTLRFAPALGLLAAGAALATASASKEAATHGGNTALHDAGQPPWGAAESVHFSANTASTQDTCTAEGSCPAPNHSAQRLFGKWPLYAKSGHPLPSDIIQSELPNCWFTATLGSLAKLCPDLIEEAIQINPDAKTVKVRLYGLSGPQALTQVGPFLELLDETPRDYSQASWIEINEHDVHANLQRGGGSAVDDYPQEDRPIWPALFEAALAKALAPKGSTGEAAYVQGYQRSAKGADVDLAARLLTGKGAEPLDFEVWGQRPGASKEERINVVFERLRKLTTGGGCIVTAGPADEDDIASTAARKKLGMRTGVKDGLEGRHAYMVERVHTNAQGEKCVLLRNPLGYNLNRELSSLRADQRNRIESFEQPGGEPIHGVMDGPLVSVPLRLLFEAGTMSFNMKVDDLMGGLFRVQ
jgi:hypothetical protein